MPKKLSKEIINSRLLVNNSSIEMIGEFRTTREKSLFKCSNGHQFMMKPNHALSGVTCGDCHRNKLNKTVINDRLLGRDITMIGEYYGVDYYTEFKGICGHIWTAKPRKILDGTSCPRCAVYGFRLEKPGYAYVIDFGDFIKFGIATNLKHRLNEHIRNNGNYTPVITKLFENGADALIWENSIKKIFGGKFVSKERCPDGWTETLSPALLERVVNTLK
jgi:hypothetical protein